MDKHLHIVTHEVPWPADFGGVVDLFYKIKALHSLGIHIHLHCFTSQRPEQKILDKYCASVNYYPRKKGLAGFSFRVPYIVQSRTDINLLKRLEADHYPVLLEGIHCSWLLQNGKLQNRKVFVRLHNVEYKYYKQLATHESNLLRKTYYNIESGLLKKYEAQLATKATIWAVSYLDEQVYKKEFGATNIHVLPVFLPWEEVSSQPGKGTYCLYQGNLSINENEQAAIWLLQQVFNDIHIPLLVAGKNPSEKLQLLIAACPHATLVMDPSENEMQELIRKAHINILPSFNNTGIKLKLLNALFNGRYCLVNKAGVAGSGMDACCNIAEAAAAFKNAVTVLMQADFTEEKIRQRVAGLNDIYNTEKNARKLIAWIY